MSRLLSPDGRAERYFQAIPRDQDFTLFHIFNRHDSIVPDLRSRQGWEWSITCRRKAPAHILWSVPGIDYQGQSHERKGTWWLVR